MDTLTSHSPHTTACLVCGSGQPRQRFIQRGYPVFSCTACGLQYVWPIPGATELAAFYDRGYQVPLERYAAASARNAARIADLERFRPERGHLLEIGASYGHSLALARERGWSVVGVELSPTASTHARERLGLTVFNCDLADAPLAEGSFDAVIMWHVLEHARNPKEQLLRLAGLLKPGGVLGLRVPNISSFGARVAGQWWPWMCPPAHLWFFSPATLPRLLRDCGFEVVEVKTLRGDGNNLYQYALIWVGNKLNGLRLVFQPRPRASVRAPQGDKAKTPAPPPSPSVNPGAPTGILQRWLDLLTRAQPITNALARGTRVLVEPLEKRGWGDELLVYARRIG